MQSVRTLATRSTRSWASSSNVSWRCLVPQREQQQRAFSALTRLHSAAGAATGVATGAGPIALQTVAVVVSSANARRTFMSATRTLWVASSAEVDKGVQNITDLFMTARDELEYAEEARGTVYYNDDKEAAREAVQDCLNSYNELLKELDDTQKLDVQRKIGLKIMELKSQLDALNTEELE